MVLPYVGSWLPGNGLLSVLHSTCCYMKVVIRPVKHLIDLKVIHSEIAPRCIGVLYYFDKHYILLLYVYVFCLSERCS